MSPVIPATEAPPPGNVIPFTERLLDLKDLTAKTKISRSQVYKMMGQGQFPRAIAVTPQMVRWRESSIDAWIIEQETKAA